MEGRCESDRGGDEVYPATFGNEEKTGLKLDRRRKTCLEHLLAHRQQNFNKLIGQGMDVRSNLFGITYTDQQKSLKVKVRDSGYKHTLFRPFSIGGPLQLSITND